MKTLTSLNKLRSIYFKLTLLLLMLAMNGQVIFAQGTSSITLILNNVTVEQAFEKLRSLYGYSFVYKTEDVNANKKISINVTDKNINDVLYQMFKGSGLEYDVTDKSIYLKSKKNTSNAVNISSNNNDVVLSGIVLDENNQPLIGASINVKGTSIGAITNLDGFFQINVKQDAVLIVSYIGYISSEIKLNGKNNLKIYLKPNLQELGEVVVVGFGSQKKVNLTGAVESVSVKDVSKRMVGQTSSALQGLIPGVSVTQRSGQPGLDGGSINVRGLTTFGDNSVLVLVDGVEMSINDLDPSLIQSISVLKDAASAAIYGSRAANGVILVTTSRAEIDKFRVSYSAHLGWQNPTSIPKKLGAIDHITLLDLANTNVGNSPIFGESKIAAYREGMSTNPDLYPDTDWYNEVLCKNGFSQNHFLTISGGSKRIRSIANFGYMGQNGVIENSKYERFTFRVNTDMEVIKGLTAKVDANVTYGKRKSPTNADIFNWVTRIPSNEVGILSTGQYGIGWNGENPIAMAKNGGTTDVTTPNVLDRKSVV